jgi:hypothetical protein
MKRKAIFFAMFIMCAGMGIQSWAQGAVPPPGATVTLYTSDQLDQLLGPIALYPDPLIAILLPAATQPAQIVLADRYITGGGDPNQIDQQPWDPSVQALGRYPSVLQWMDENLAWTTELGQAFINQQQDVMDSIQRLRAQAMSLGNLQSTPQQNVDNENGIIEILPANPDVIYVPVYQPVYVYQDAPPSPGFYVTFGIGLPIGIWLNCDFDWFHHNLIYWGHNNPRPVNWWQRPHNERDYTTVQHVDVWRPQSRGITAVGRTQDRGWGTSNVRPGTANVGHPVSVTAIGTPGHTQMQQTRPEASGTPAPSAWQEAPHTQAPVVRNQTPVESPHSPAPTVGSQEASGWHPTSAPQVNRGQSEPNGAFIGVDNPRETSSYSNRGEQSRQEISSPRPAPSPAPQQQASAPPARSSSPSSGGGSGIGNGKR